MGNVENFAALNSKIKTLEGKMLSEEQYEGLLKTRNYFEALKYLKNNTSYNEAIKDINISDIHRGDLEIILKRYYVEIFFKLSHFLKGEYRELLQLLFLELQVEDLKVIIRAKYVDNYGDIKGSLVTYGSPLNKIPYDELIEEKNIEALSKRINDTKVFKHVSPLLNNFKKESLFRIEMTLDFEYFSSIRKFIKKLDKENGTILKKINGSLVDMLNLQWIYRGMNYYKLSSEELFNYTIYNGYKIKGEKLRNLCYIKDIDEFYSYIDKTIYGKVFSKVRGKDYLLEREINSYIRKLLSKFKSKGKLNIAELLSYTELVEIEIGDIISIVENKRYMTEESEISKYLTGVNIE